MASWRFLLFFFISTAHAQQSPPKRLPSVGELRKQIEDLEQAKREGTDSSKPHWREIPPLAAITSSSKGRGSPTALVELVYEGKGMGCVWKIEPANPAGEKPIVVCLDTRASEWIRLPAGAYNLTLRAGDAGGQSTIFPSENVQAEANLAYQVTFGAADETAVKDRIRELARQKEAADSKKKGRK